MVTNTLPDMLLYFLGAVVLLGNAVHGMMTGRSSTIIPGGFKRSEHPVQYWSSIIIYCVLGTGSLFILVTSLWNTL